MTRVIVYNHIRGLDQNKETPRAGYKGKGSHAYKASDFEIVCMGDDRWYVFLSGRDLGVDFSTLRQARLWVKEQVNA
jgi:hypothetical protein